MERCGTAENYFKMRGLLKMLMTKGMYQSDLIKQAQVAKNTSRPAIVYSKDEALANVMKNTTRNEREQYWRKFEAAQARKRGKKEDPNRVVHENVIGSFT
jgi:transcription initiation factor IIE alpha subunit